MKVHELAKELDINAKDLLEKIKSLGYEVKSHLSVIDDDIISAVKKSNVSLKTKTVKDDIKEEKNMTTKKEKNINPIIIRREVQVVNQEPKEIKKEFQKKEEIGVVKRKSERDYNIINRNKQKTQVGSIADLFKKPVSQSDTNEKTEKESSSKRVNTYAILEKQRNRNYSNTSNKFNTSASSDNKQNNRDNNVRQYKTNSQQKQEYNKPNKPQFDKPYDNRNKPNNTGRKLDKDTKTATTQVFNDEPHKDYRISKKPVQQNDDNKKNANRFSKHSTNDDLDMDKLKDLKSHDSLSGLFNDSEGGMLDYYDVSNHRKNKKAFNKKQKELNKKKFEKNKIFELKEITIPESISVKDLAEAMKKTSAEVIKKLFNLGIMATINQELDFDTAFLVAQEFTINAIKQVVVTDEEILFDETEDIQEDLLPRAPIVVVMGHVDHGKTSLLDAIRSTNVSEKEAGGITQHIGAYKVNVNGRDITFLDTPGHEAFTSMRARGAKITDIVILVVAADDGIMPQTVEAINHAKAANVPIIVAINKMDKQGTNIQKIKQSLLDYELVPEEYGGKTICVPISAKNHQGINELLEMVLLEADMLDLRSNPNKQSKGTVIESRLDTNRGTVTTLLVQRGTLDIGDTIVLGNNIGKIRAMVDDKGKNIEHAGPSTPVEIIGLPEVSVCGDIFYEVENEKVAKHLIEQRRIRQREKNLKTNNIITVEDLFNK
ncbi:MAG: translation initiation factor IF-2, partial [Clostridia bacterium]|nr:translation initiation factor IF-2 [Clostridia bacterium]